MARLISLAAGVDTKHLDKAMSAYVDELTQLRYAVTPLNPVKQGQKNDAQMLSRVAELSSSAK